MLDHAVKLFNDSDKTKIEFFTGWMDRYCSKRKGQCTIIGHEVAPMIYDAYVKPQFSDEFIDIRYLLMLLATNYLLLELNKKYNVIPFTSVYFTESGLLKNFTRDERLFLDSRYKTSEPEKYHISNKVIGENVMKLDIPNKSRIDYLNKMIKELKRLKKNKEHYENGNFVLQNQLDEMTKELKDLKK